MPWQSRGSAIVEKFVAKNAEDVVYGEWLGEALFRCERLMLASRRAKKRVSAFECMRLRSDVATIQHLAAHCKVGVKAVLVGFLQVCCTSAVFAISSNAFVSKQ